MALRPHWGRRGVCNLWVWQVLVGMAARTCRRGKSRPFGDKESIGRDAERRVMVKATPPASFIMAEPEFLLEILIVALDAPAQLGLIDQNATGRGGRAGPGQRRSVRTGWCCCPRARSAGARLVWAGSPPAPWPRWERARHRAELMRWAGHAHSRALAATAPCPAATGWYETGCRRHSSDRVR